MASQLRSLEKNAEQKEQKHSKPHPPLIESVQRHYDRLKIGLDRNHCKMREDIITAEERARSNLRSSILNSMPEGCMLLDRRWIVRCRGMWSYYCEDCYDDNSLITFTNPRKVRWRCPDCGSLPAMLYGIRGVSKQAIQAIERTVRTWPGFDTALFDECDAPQKGCLAHATSIIAAVPYGDVVATFATYHLKGQHYTEKTGYPIEFVERFCEAYNIAMPTVHVIDRWNTRTRNIRVARDGDPKSAILLLRNQDMGTVGHALVAVAQQPGPMERTYSSDGSDRGWNPGDDDVYLGFQPAENSIIAASFNWDDFDQNTPAAITCGSSRFDFCAPQVAQPSNWGDYLDDPDTQFVSYYGTPATLDVGLGRCDGETAEIASLAPPKSYCVSDAAETPAFVVVFKHRGFATVLDGKAPPLKFEINAHGVFCNGERYVVSCQGLTARVNTSEYCLYAGKNGDIPNVKCEVWIPSGVRDIYISRDIVEAVQRTAMAAPLSASIVATYSVLAAQHYGTERKLQQNVTYDDLVAATVRYIVSVKIRPDGIRTMISAEVNELYKNTATTKLAAANYIETLQYNPRSVWQRFRQKHLKWTYDDLNGFVPLRRHAVVIAGGLLASAAVVAGFSVCGPVIATLASVACLAGLIKIYRHTCYHPTQPPLWGSMEGLRRADLFIPVGDRDGLNVDCPPDMPLRKAPGVSLCEHGQKYRHCAACRIVRRCGCGHWLVDGQCSICRNGDVSIIACAQDSGIILPIPYNHNYPYDRPSCLTAMKPATQLKDIPEDAKFYDTEQLDKNPDEPGSILVGRVWAPPVCGGVPSLVPNKSAHTKQNMTLAIVNRVLQSPSEPAENWDYVHQITREMIAWACPEKKLRKRMVYAIWNSRPQVKPAQRVRNDRARHTLGWQFWRMNKRIAQRKAFMKTELLHKMNGTGDLINNGGSCGVAEYAPRAIQGYDDMINVAYNPIALAVSEVLKKLFPLTSSFCYGVGLNSLHLGRWFQLAGWQPGMTPTALDNWWKCLENDYTLYDSTQGIEAHKNNIILMEELGFTDTIISQVKRMHMTTQGRTPYGQYYSLPDDWPGMCSGSGDTSQQNTWNGMSAMVAALCRTTGLTVAQLAEQCRLIETGDDNDTLVRCQVDKDAIVGFLRSLGFKPKLSEKRFCDLRFCAQQPWPAVVDGVECLVAGYTLGRLGSKLGVSLMPQPDWPAWLGGNAAGLKQQVIVPGFEPLLHEMAPAGHTPIFDYNRRVSAAWALQVRIEPHPQRFEWALERLGVDEGMYDDFRVYVERTPCRSISSHIVMAAHAAYDL
jgi:hypothetical protein